ncbi:hypothetical protein C8J55DRAFT_559690 [Lentinula edodes]|uniref:Uncharacterized protein n=1 Tax=Lentinula lateritia TaxID=40482 RepID=A0A9W9AJA6_9AGAR|nr:hypothetical protein C8J55DRAFT_559690 [Lentinula edodes]
MARYTTSYRRKPSNVLPRFVECNRMGCSNPVKVWLCTGSNYAHHRGHWYESCVNKDNPQDTHFVFWRPDLPPQHISDLVWHEVRGVLPKLSPKKLSQMSMHDILTQTTEAHPFSAFPPSPSRMLDRPNQGSSPVKQSTASMENLFDFSEAMEIEIPDQVFTEEEAREFAQSVDLAEEEQGIEGSVVLGIQLLHEQLTQHLSASANSNISNPVTADSALVTDEPPSQDTLIISASSSTQSHSKEPISSFLHNSNDSDFPPPQPPYPSSTTPPFIWNPGKTETRLVNGSMRACCLGCGCAGKAGATINTNCSFKLCKPCCGKYQAEMNITCKEASHKPQAKTST